MKRETGKKRGKRVTEACRECVTKNCHECEFEGEVVTDRATIDAKWGRKFAESSAEMNAAEVKRLREKLATVTQEASTDMQAMRQEVVTAQMWRRWEKRKREQERQKHDHELAELARAKITANETNETTIGNKPRLRKPKPRKQMEHLTAQGLIRGAGGKGRNIPLRIEPDQLSFSIAGRKGVYTFRPSGRKLLDALLTAYSKQDGGGWVELPKERNGLRKKIGNLFPPATASLIQRETRTPCGGGYTGRVRLWVVEQ